MPAQCVPLKDDDGPALSARSAAALAIAMLPAWLKAAEPEALDEEFLEYLAEFEDEDDIWAWLAQENDEKKAKPEPAVKPAARHDEVKP
jgi:hypothetical protein